MKKAALLLVPLLLATSWGVSANDSVAEMAAGGLVLAKSDSIEMRSEDLYISMDQVRVRYVFFNRSTQPIQTRVAFPLPDRDLALELESDTSFPEGFRTLVEGRTVAMEVERRAVLDGVDQTAALSALAIPLVEDERESQRERLAAMTATDRRHLERSGLVEVEWLASGPVLHPLWTVKETWHWTQLFPSRQPLVIEHSYAPAVGGTAGVPLADAGFRSSPEGRETAAQHCADDAFLAALDRMAALQESRGYLVENRIGYILSTGANWAGPIGDFRLVVDKGSPDSIVSFCGSGVRRLSPTRFEMRRRNFTPDRDLSILIVRHLTPDGE